MLLSFWNIFSPDKANNERKERRGIRTWVTTVGKNSLAKMMSNIAKMAELSGKFTNTSECKTFIQTLRDEFNPLEMSELTGHANTDSITSYSHNPLEKQRRMSNKLAGFSKSTAACATTSNSGAEPNSVQLSLAPQTSVAGPPKDQNTVSLSYLTGALGGLFSAATFINSTVNVAIHQHHV